MRARVSLVALLALGCSLTAGPASPPAPPPAPVAARAPTERPTVAAGVRYVVRETGGAGPEDRLPLIIAVHGLGDRPEAFLDVFEGLPLRARIVAVRGLDPYLDGFAWFPLGGADGEGGAFRRAVDALAAAIPEVARQRPTCGLPVITGFSQGGMLSFALAARAPAIVRAAVPIAGRLPMSMLPLALPDPRPEVTALHGTADGRIPFAQGDTSVQALRARGFRAEMRAFEGVGHVIPPPVRAALFDALRRYTAGGC